MKNIFFQHICQTSKPICDEIIAVDDNSTDNSRKIMEDAGVIVKGYELSLIHI